MNEADRGESLSIVGTGPPASRASGSHLRAPAWVRWVWLTLAMAAGATALWYAVETITIVAIALLLAAALGPTVNWLVARRWPRAVAATTVFLGLLAALIAFVAFLAPILVSQTQQALTTLPALVARLDWLRETWSGWREQYALIPRFAELSLWAGRRLLPILNRMMDVPGQFLAWAFTTFTVLFLTFFFVKDGPILRSQIVGLVPPAARPDVEHFWDRLVERVGGYVLGQLTVMVLVGCLTGLGLWVLGVPYPLLLGLLVGLLDIVPFVGPLLGALPGLVLAFGMSWQTGLWALAIYWGVQQLEGYFLYPAITGRATSLHPVWILLALLLGAQFLGLVGMVLAVPAAVALQVLIDEWYRPHLEAQAGPGTQGSTLDDG